MPRPLSRVCSIVSTWALRVLTDSPVDSLTSASASLAPSWRAWSSASCAARSWSSDSANRSSSGQLRRAGKCGQRRNRLAMIASDEGPEPTAADRRPETGNDGRPSKSQRKREMTALQALGESLLGSMPRNCSDRAARAAARGHCCRQDHASRGAATADAVHRQADATGRPGADASGDRRSTGESSAGGGADAPLRALRERLLADDAALDRAARQAASRRTCRRCAR
jgi:hypothetical protein